jgi:vacuolar-type H+-ATPase subunit H
MNQSSEQEQYIKSLVQIKEIEEKVQKELNERKLQVEAEIKLLEEGLANSVKNAENDGRQLVETSIQSAREKAELEAREIISEAETKSKNISFKFDPSMVKEIFEVIFSDIK